MPNQKQEVVDSVRPFIRYLDNLSLPRKIGFAFFIKTCSLTPGRLKEFLGSCNAAYKWLLSGSIHMPIIFGQALTLACCILFILSVANSASYLHYFFAIILLAFSTIIYFVIKMSAISKAGLALQFRIPENFEKLARIIDQHRHGMIISKSPNVRYAVISFNDVRSGDLDAFKLVATINGVLEHFDITGMDIKDISGKEGIIEQLLNDKNVSRAQHGQ